MGICGIGMIIGTGLVVIGISFIILFLINRRSIDFD